MDRETGNCGRMKASRVRSKKWIARTNAQRRATFKSVLPSVHRSVWAVVEIYYYGLVAVVGIYYGPVVETAQWVVSGSRDILWSAMDGQ